MPSHLSFNQEKKSDFGSEKPGPNFDPAFVLFCVYFKGFPNRVTLIEGVSTVYMEDTYVHGIV